MEESSDAPRKRKKITCTHGRHAHVRGRNNCLWCEACGAGLLTCGHSAELVRAFCEHTPRPAGDYIYELRFVLDLLVRWDERVAPVRSLTSLPDADVRAVWADNIRSDIVAEERSHGPHYSAVAKQCVKCMLSKRRKLLKGPRVAGASEDGEAEALGNVLPPEGPEPVLDPNRGILNITPAGLLPVPEAKRGLPTVPVQLPAAGTADRRPLLSTTSSANPSPLLSHRSLHTPRQSKGKSPLPQLHRDTVSPQQAMPFISSAGRPSLSRFSSAKRKRSPASIGRDGLSKRNNANGQPSRTSRTTSVTSPFTVHAAASDEHMYESDDSLIDRSQGPIQSALAKASKATLKQLYAELCDQLPELSREILGSRLITDKGIIHTWLENRLEVLGSKPRPNLQTHPSDELEEAAWSEDDEEEDENGEDENGNEHERMAFGFVDEGYDDSSDDSGNESSAGLLAQFRAAVPSHTAHDSSRSHNEMASSTTSMPCAAYHKTYEEWPLGQLGECHFHSGTLIYASSYNTDSRKWYAATAADLKMVKIKPEMFLWTCCKSIGNSPPCQKGTHAAANPAPERIPIARALPSHSPLTNPQLIGSSSASKVLHNTNGINQTTQQAPNTVVQGQNTANSSYSPTTPEISVHTSSNSVSGPATSFNDIRSKFEMFEDIPDVTPAKYLLSGHLRTNASNIIRGAPILRDFHAVLLVPQELEIARRNGITCARYLYYKRKLFWEVAHQFANFGIIKKNALVSAAAQGISKARFTDIMKEFADAGMLEASFFDEHVKRRYEAHLGQKLSKTGGDIRGGEAQSAQGVSLPTSTKPSTEMPIRSTSSSTDTDKGVPANGRGLEGAVGRQDSGHRPEHVSNMTQRTEEDSQEDVTTRSQSPERAPPAAVMSKPSEVETPKKQVEAGPSMAAVADSGRGRDSASASASEHNTVDLSALMKKIYARREPLPSDSEVFSTPPDSRADSRRGSGSGAPASDARPQSGMEKYPMYARGKDSRHRRARKTIDKPDRVFEKDGCPHCVMHSVPCYVNEESGKCAYCISLNRSTKLCAKNWANYPYKERFTNL